MQCLRELLQTWFIESLQHFVDRSADFAGEPLGLIVEFERPIAGPTPS
jgi:hypothetical protein